MKSTAIPRRKETRLSKALNHCLVAFSLALFAAGCAIPQVPSRIVYEDPVNFVRLELDGNVLREWPPSYFAHPVGFTEQQIRRILKGITVQEHRVRLQKWFLGEAPRVPVFREEEI